MRQWYVLVPGTVAGLAAWCTLGTLDLTSEDGQFIRVAMLPSPARAALLAVAGAMASFLIEWVTHRAMPGRVADSRHHVTTPLWITAILCLPYLPILADLWPALVVLTGPAKSFVWVSAIVLCLLAATRRAARHWTWSPKTARLAWVVLLASTTVCGAAAARLARTPLFPSGDQPHYLVIAQSLWRDGDLRIENNHRRGDAAEYFQAELEPHYLTRGTDGEIYSVHPVGLPVVLAPIFAAAGYEGVVVFLVLVAALAATVAWWLASTVTGSAAAASFGWLACCVSAPFIFNSISVYPEMLAALMVLVAYGLASGLLFPLASGPRWRSCGIAIAALPWLSTKYALMAGALGVIALTRLLWPDERHRRSSRDILRSVLALCLPPVLSLAGWFTFFWIVWGTPSPGAPYGGASGTELRHLLRGGPGLFFDQEYGLLATAPALWLGIAGLGAMARQAHVRRIAAELIVVIIALLVVVGSFHIWWGGSAAMGRPMMAVLPLLVIPIAWRFQQRSTAPLLRIGYGLLVMAGLAMALVLGSSHDGLLLASERNGLAPLLRWASPSWNLPAIFPSFIVDPWAVAMACAGVWLGALLVAGLLARRERAITGAALLRLAVAGAGALGLASLLVPLAFGGWLRGPLRLEGRTEIPLLNTFLPQARPLAVRYAPLTFVAPSEVPRFFRLVARASDGRPDAPIRLLHQARWSLPAGRYRVELIAGGPEPLPAGETLRLQVGRLGPPIETWPVTFGASGRWHDSFEIPLWAGSVGFIASPALAERSPAIVVTPLTIRDTAGAPPPEEVFAAGRFGQVWVLMHHDRLAPEPEGFWTPGASTARFTMVAGGPPTLRLRAGPLATSVRLVLPDREERLELVPRQERDVHLAPQAGDAWPVTVEVTGSFVPSEKDPNSRDRRRLGVFIMPRS